MLYYITVNNKRLKVKVARTPSDKARGLMDTQEKGSGVLGPNEGMLFVYPEEQILSFWMKNTSIPLSIAFIGADRKIQQIEEMEPHNEALIKSKQPAQYALEVNSGWFDKHNITRGDTITIPKRCGIKIRVLKQ